LSPREWDVPEHLSRRLPNKEISRSLDVHDETIKWNVKNLFEKLDAGSRKLVVSRPDHVKFTSFFGGLQDHPVAGSDPDNPGLARIYKSPDPSNDRYVNAWHTYAAWHDKPPMGCVLGCVECPPVGGDTMWVNMVEAYARLPEDIKAKIDGRKAHHSIEASFGAAMPEDKRLGIVILPSIPLIIYGLASDNRSGTCSLPVSCRAWC